MHTVAVLALDGVLAFDLSTPIEVFGRACLPDGHAAYRVRVCGPAAAIDAGAFILRAPWGLDTLAVADTIILPDLADPTAPLPADALAALRTAAAARIAVMPLERAGGQAQFITHEPPTSDGATLEPLLRWMDENAHRDLTLADIAARAMISTRTLNRRFRAQTGATPLHWLRRARLRQAQYLLETTDHSVERIAGQVGFGSPTTFRERFKRLVGTSPQAYRRAFRGTTTR